EVPFDREQEPSADDVLLRRALEVAVLCNNASLGAEDGSVGDPTEVALLEAAARLDLDRDDLLGRWPEVREVAFDAETKRMATVHRKGDEVRTAVKGAPEAILKLCSRAAGGEGDDPAGWSEEERRQWEQKNRELAGRGLRVLALAEKRGGPEDGDPYGDLTFLGLVSLMDPPREDVKEVLAGCRDAGIRIIMVTGDQRDTAVGVAEAVALTGGEEIIALQGEELASPEERSAQDKERLVRASVFARVSPEQKLELVRLHQERGSVVAMTGDGVNDAPALKKADIGVAMGERGTQVAREAADMVLTDDRLATVAVAVEYGRVVFENIRKFIVFLLSGNVSEVLVLTAAGLVGAPLPLLPLQILYVNLIGDVFPALALGVGPEPPGVMRRPPRRREEPILTRSHWVAVGGYSLILSAAILAAFAAALLVLDLDAAGAVTVSFLTLIFARLLHVFNVRDRDSPVFRNEITGNPYVWGALAICVALALFAVYVPWLAQVLGLRPLGASSWGLVLGASGAALLVGQCATPFLAPARTGRTAGRWAPKARAGENR
ncbi:MAG: HAD-IC family P-type ATPase, partial [Thermodesulfobacteriota bacterium]